MHTLKWYTLIHQIMFFSEFFKTMEPLKKAKYRRVSQHCADLPKKKRKKRNMLIFEIMHYSHPHFRKLAKDQDAF